MGYATFKDLEGASVFITGGGSGIGAALTDGFLGQGANVTFVQRSNADSFLQEMQDKHGRQPIFIECDITNTTALQSAISSASDLQGPVTVLVNNAANDVRHETLKVDEEFWDRNQAINLKPYFFAAQTVVPGMQASGGGSIINFSSISYIMGNAGYPSYVAANAGITGLTRGLAREFGPSKIRVNALAPGWVLTDKQLEKWATPEGLAAHLERQCIDEHLKPQDIVETCLFLGSKASRMITSQTIAVDGGVVVSG